MDTLFMFWGIFGAFIFILVHSNEGMKNVPRKKYQKYAIMAGPLVWVVFLVFFLMFED